MNRVVPSIPDLIRRRKHKRTDDENTLILDSILERDSALFAKLPDPKVRSKYSGECEGEGDYYSVEDDDEEEEEDEEEEQSKKVCGKETEIIKEPEPQKDYPLDVSGIEPIVPEESTTVLTKEQFEKKHRAHYELTLPKFYFTPANIRHLKEAFECFDTYSIGYMKTKDLFILLRCLDFNADKSELKEILKMIDPKRSRLLSFGDFIRVVDLQLQERDSMSDLERGFRDMDLERKGRITPSNLAHCAYKIKKDINPEEVLEMIQYADKEKQGSVKVEGFKRALNRRTIYEK